MYISAVFASLFVVLAAANPVIKRDAATVLVRTLIVGCKPR
jgi:hypothetical protein